MTHVDVSDSQQNLGVRRPSYSNNAFSNNALNAIRRDQRFFVGDAPDFVEVGEAGIAVDHAMRRQRRVQLVG